MNYCGCTISPRHPQGLKHKGLSSGNKTLHTWCPIYLNCAITKLLTNNGQLWKKMLSKIFAVHAY